MKRKFLAALLALVMVFSMIPVSASADGPIYEGNDTFRYHITDSSLANMVAEKRPAGSSSDVSEVTITFNHDYSAGGQNTFVFRYGYTIALSNVSDYVQPDDIACLTISFVDGTSVNIPQNELSWTWVETLPRRYDLRLKTDDNTCTVTFYYQPGDTVDDSSWEEYKLVSVQTGTSLGESMPALPDKGTAHWVAWETGDNDGTGAEFTADTVVNSDLSVYARKVTDGSGSEYNVMNQDNSLLEAVLKLYVDENPDSGVTTDNVQISGISVNGSEASTNPYYDPVIGSQGPTDNGWRDSNSYFYIYNLDAGAGLIDRNTNTRVPPDDLRSITVYATVDGDNETYTIFRSDLDVRVEDNATIKIYIRDTSEEEEVTPPAAPDKETVIDLAGENAVAVECTTNEEHEQTTSALNKGSITVGDVVSIGEGEYTCTVTVTPDSYVIAYNNKYPDHSLSPTGQTGEILLVSNGEGWTIAGTAPYVTFKVACETEPEEETPEKPDGTWIANNIAVNVNCFTGTHSPKKYNLEKYASISEVAKDTEGYFFTITINANDYVARYNSDVEPTHSLDGSESITVTVRYTEKDKNDWYWVANPSSVTINVKCDSGTTEPEKPDEDAVIKLLGNEAVLVQCDVADSGHAPRNYPLLSGTFAIGNVENNTVKVTVDSKEYLKEYTLYSGKEHSEVIAQDENYFTLTWNGEDWTVSGNPVTFTVHCSTTEEPEEPTAPDVAKILGTNAVEVLCVTNNGIHGSKTYGLLNGGYMEQGPDWITGQGEEDGYWQYVVTIDASVYQAQFNTDTKSKHDLASPAETYLPITLIYRDNTWVIEGTEPYAIIELVCDSEEPTLPEKPDDETIYDIFNGNKPVVLACVTENSGHEEQAFDLIPGSYKIGEVKKIGGRYLCDITIVNEQVYIDIYNTETDKEHSLSSANQSQKLTLKYTDGAWAIDDDGTVYYTVACEDTSTEPTPTPTPTPDPTPTPTPTPDPGDDNNPPYNPPYIPPVDPDDSGVSDLLNTDDHIQYLFGYPEGTFGPENNMTRAEVAQMFYNLLLDQDVTITKTFDDVPANAWYAKAVNTLASLGVVSGVGNGDFEPERSITRAEFTSIAMKFAEGKNGGTNIFSDVKSTDWFYRAVVNSTQYGWIHGYGDGTFRPNNPITRVEVTAIVNNMLGREADVDFVTEHYDELNHFSDLAVSHWGYYHIVEATNDHDYTKPSSGENWTELN